MKAYILDTINRIKRFSESLDVSTLLCNKTWVVFNDTGDKEVLIFQPDNTVLITNNGVGVNRTWKWIVANKSLIINIEEDSIIMLHPEFVNNLILALNLDGTNKYSFLIEENNQQNFAPQTLSELQQYFENIENKAIEEEEKKRLEIERAKIENELIVKADHILNNVNIIRVILIIFALVILPITISVIYLSLQRFTLTLMGTIFLLLFVVIIVIIALFIPSIKAQNYIKKHPNDPVNQYLKNMTI